MTENTCQLICDCKEEILIDVIHKWWNELKYLKKEVLVDLLPARFFCNFRRGHYRGEDRVHFEFKIQPEDLQTVLKIYMVYPEWSPLHPFDMFQEIVCWYISALKKQNVNVKIKQGMFSRKIEC
jgi:hypothetical protein